MKGETWRPVPGFEGIYEVSDHGRVRSLDKVVRCKGGTRVHRGKVLSPGKKRRGGYLYASLCLCGDIQYLYVHRLVLSAFEGPPSGGLQTCHNDGDPTNNRLDNLRYDTRDSNEADKRKHGTHFRMPGERNPSSKLTAVSVVSIRTRRAAGEPLPSISKDYGISRQTVSKICRGETWIHVGGPLTKRPTSQVTI